MRLKYFRIEGGRALSGKAAVHGAKNSILALLAASYLSGGESVFENCPDLTDVRESLEILNALGAKTSFRDRTITVDASGANGSEIPAERMLRMRSSILFFGAAAAKTGRATCVHPGGCAIGERPIDLHLWALRQLGLAISEEYGILNCKTDRGIRGAALRLSFPSVGATEQVMITAALSKGETVLYNAAREPELVDLQNYLNLCGAEIRGAGSSTIVIRGKSSLSGAQWRVMPDRIEAATLLCAVLSAGGEIVLENARPVHFRPVLEAARQMGAEITEGGEIRIKAPKRLRAIPEIATSPYPGFPTDAQAILMAAAAKAEGTSIFYENIFENRFQQVSELAKMGAKIRINGRMAAVEGRETLSGADVSAADLRGGAALMVAALGAQGVSRVFGVDFIDRGYETPESTLESLGACVRREEKGSITWLIKDSKPESPQRATARSASGKES